MGNPSPGFRGLLPLLPCSRPRRLPFPALPVQLPASSFCSWYYTYKCIHYMYSNKIYSRESRPDCRKKARKNRKKNLDRIYQLQTLILWKITCFREKQSRNGAPGVAEWDATRRGRIAGGSRSHPRKAPGPALASAPVACMSPVVLRR